MAVEKKQILNKLYLLTGFLFLFAMAIIYKLIEIEHFEGDLYRVEAEQGTVKTFEIAANRGSVYTSDGSLLATSVSRFDVRMDAVTISDNDFEAGIKDLSVALSDMLGKSAGYYENKIRKARINKNRYLFITRNLSYNDYQRLKKFPIFELGTYRGGLIIEQRTVREHPIGKIAERAVGYDDYRGRVGIEGSFYEFLRGKKGKRLKQKIAKGQWKPLNDNNEIEPIDGKDIITTLDLKIQDVAHHALLGQLEKFEADHGSVVVMETKTGEIKAISNLGRTSKGTYFEQRNYAIYESHEPGSTFKLMGMVVALEDKVIDTSEVIDTEKGVIRFHGKPVRDSHHGGYGEISAARVFEVSSNVGIVKIINSHYGENPQKFIQGLERMNVGQKIGLPIKGEGEPKIPNPKDKETWNGLSLPWMAYGYGVSFTPLQTLTFYNAIANNGEMVKPRFVKEIRDQSNVVTKFEKEIIHPQVCSQETIDKVKEMMLNVVKRGTADNIYDPSFSMAGKTGTCQTEYWTDDTKYISSFVGYFPADEPKYSCIVVIHKPNKKKGYYGNVVAAPVFERIARKIYTDTPIEKEVSFANELVSVDQAYDGYYAKANENFTKMPDVRNMPGMDAVSLLENMGLKVRISGIGKVKSQSIKAGSELKKGEIIRLELS
ncbi:transpeptidase family protein [Lutimonas saemankumensis]|uniref:penicillin-binding protein n=1 Tax=Lutimonas saemankumensis TaxID=483016 RepID=UPI001CD68E88|nr:penicillin-binding protein [Lutimonas saemankumensis]MCA0933598.1 transpeptidase family protein [Lutimonas saemankumensis]